MITEYLAFISLWVGDNIPDKSYLQNIKHIVFTGYIVFNSYHMGKGKRDISLFDDIAGLLKTTPDRILFIDDDPGNVERARQKGWNAIFSTDAGSFRSEMNQWAPQAAATPGGP